MPGPLPAPPPPEAAGRAARVTCALTGGVHHTAADREAAAAIEGAFPGTGEQLLAGRSFHARAAERAITREGIRGVIIAAAGYPCPPDPHRGALGVTPAAGTRFVFLDPDEEVTDVNLDVPGADPRVTAARAHAAGPAGMLAVPEVAALPRPLLVMLPLVAGWWPGDVAAGVLAELGRLLPSGSLAALTLWVPDGGGAGEEFLAAWRRHVGPACGHTAADVTGWLEGAGMAVMPPGPRDARILPGRDWAEEHYSLRSPGRVIGAAARVR
jgi:hypothetical protein